MSGDERTEALRWVQFATDDLGAAKTIHGDGHLPHRLVCFHCQQSIEKALKGLLVRLKIDFPRTHDLNLLRRLLPHESAVKQAFPDFSGLNAFAVETRYPGDFPEACETDAVEALTLAEQVLDAVQTAVA
jgi:HEPN domain-containing protein